MCVSLREVCSQNHLGFRVLLESQAILLRNNLFAVLTDSGKNYLQLLDEDCTFSSLRIVVGFPKKIIGSLIAMKVWVNHPQRMLKKK